jgi:hypothetical protein
LNRFQESFESLRRANELRLAELKQPNEWRREYSELKQNAEKWELKPIEQDTCGSGTKLLVILGPSRSGKSTLERLICRDGLFKRGYEGGGGASAATRNLQQISKAMSTSTSLSGEQISQRLFAALFPTGVAEFLGGEHRVVTITNPFLLAAAHLIYDLYPGSRFVFLERDAVDNATEIYAKDYRAKYPFAYSPHGSLDYVELFHEVSSALCQKMDKRAVRISYEDMIVSPASVLTSIYAMLGMELPANPAPTAAARDSRSVYREFFAALCAEQDKNPRDEAGVKRHAVSIAPSHSA